MHVLMYYDHAYKDDEIPSAKTNRQKLSSIAKQKSGVLHMPKQE